MKYKWLFLDGEMDDRLEGWTVREMGKALLRMNIPSASVKLWEKGQLISESDLRKVIRDGDPEYIVWTGATGWNYFSVLAESMSKKVNLWFDDPIMRTAGDPRVQDGMRGSRGHSSFKVFVWDRHWMKVLKDVLGVDSTLIHLAADTQDYFPAKTIQSDDLVFIGNLHSPSKIWGVINDTPKVFQDFVGQAIEIVKQCPGIIPSWDQIMETTEKVMDQGDVQVWAQSCLSNLDYMRMVQCAIWHLSKNEARIRMLKEAVKVHPVRMFTETNQRFHASVEEVKGMIGEWNDKKFKVETTNHINQQTIGHLYHYGRLHLQATDPQSVTEGIPYRVFQCAASGRPLLSDWRSGWGECFEQGKEILTYTDGTFGKVLEDALKEDLTGISDAFRKRCMENHTWEKRIEYIMNQCGGFSLFSDVMSTSIYNPNNAINSLEKEIEKAKQKVSEGNTELDVSQLSSLQITGKASYPEK